MKCWFNQNILDHLSSEKLFEDRVGPFKELKRLTIKACLYEGSFVLTEFVRLGKMEEDCDAGYSS